MSNDLKIGLIGLDTSHVVRFAEILNDANNPHHLSGARIVAGFPAGSPDFELSRSRVEGFSRQLAEQFGVEILSSPEAVAERVDLLFITAVDGRTHRDLFEKTIGFRRPTFIDKPFTTSRGDAQAILQCAKAADVAIMSCSSTRYADNLRAALARPASNGAIVGCNIFGPMAIEPAQPGLFWYGIHCVEMMFAVMGTGCRSVQVRATDDADIVAAEWPDGRLASIHGLRGAHERFGVTIHRAKEFDFIDIKASSRPYYASLLEVILACLPQNRSAIPPEEMLEVVSFIEAANASRKTGQSVDIEPSLFHTDPGAAT